MIVKVQREWGAVKADLKVALSCYKGSPAELSRSAQIDYFSARRYLRRAPENQTESALRLCTYFNINLDIQSPGLQVVLEAVSEVWDGSEEHAKSLAGIIKWSQTIKLGNTSDSR